MLYLFDLDGTLITSYMDNPDKDFHRWRVLPRRKERLSSLREAGHSVGVVTNQAGIAFGHVTPEDWTQRKLPGVCHELSLLPNEVFYCFAHPRARPPWNHADEVSRRKPAPMMIAEAMDHFHAEQDDTLYVGDMETDRLAARNAGVEYMDAEDFFSKVPS